MAAGFQPLRQMCLVKFACITHVHDQPPVSPWTFLA
jgi:hypothetical protein